MGDRARFFGLGNVWKGRRWLQSVVDWDPSEVSLTRQLELLIVVDV